MNEYLVTVPVTAIAYITVQANSEKEAEDLALDNVSMDNIEEWEAVRQITQGNVCYALSPWEIVVEDQGPIE